MIIRQAALVAIPLAALLLLAQGEFGPRVMRAVTRFTAADGTAPPSAGAITTSAAAAAAALQAAPASGSAAMPLGVQTHFSQGWATSLVDRVRSSGAMGVRDSIPWSRGEPTRGRYAIDSAAPAALDAICRAGGSLLLTLTPQHPAYDNGRTVNSDAGITAFARYAGELGARYGTCLAGIEIGNEINDSRNLNYPAGLNWQPRYVILVRAVRRELRRRGSNAAAVGGSTNVIGTGFLDSLFAAGLLNAADAIAVHPYRSNAENVDFEIAHLQAVMRRRGKVLPIWATEFSDNYATDTLAAEQLVRMVTLLSTAGVARSYWYALIDQRWFRNMGLYAANGSEKPAARAYAQMIPLTRAARATPVDVGDAGIRLYRFGNAGFVLWGGGGRVTFSGRPVVRDAYGRAVQGGGATVEAGTIPLVITGASDARLAQRSGILADTMFGYGKAPWSYLAQTSDRKLHPLDLLDGQFDTSFGSRFYRPLRISGVSAAVAGTGGSPTRAIIRYTAPSARTVSFAACFMKQANGDGVDIAIIAAGRTIWKRVLKTQEIVAPIDVSLARGDQLDISVGPNQTSGGDSFSYRARLFTQGSGRTVACPNRAVPAG